jgi:lupus La protein
LDKFLFEKVQGHKNLPVPLTLIHSFRRMRHFKPFSAIVEALKESTVLELADGDTTVRRKIPIAEELCGNLGEIQKVLNDKTMPQSVYVKGFGEETSTTQFDLERFFKEFGSVNAVRLRRAVHDRSFKGSVFVEFKDEDTAKAFLNLDPQPKWNGKDLLIKSKKQYCDEKIDEINAKRAKGSADKDHAAKDNWKARREEDQKNGSNRGGRGGRGGRGPRGGRGRGGHRPNQGEDSKRGGKRGQVDFR